MMYYRQILNKRCLILTLLLKRIIKNHIFNRINSINKIIMHKTIKNYISLTKRNWKILNNLKVYLMKILNKISLN